MHWHTVYDSRSPLHFHFVSPILDTHFSHHFPLMSSKFILEAIQTCLIHKTFVTTVSYHLMVATCKGFSQVQIRTNFISTFRFSSTTCLWAAAPPLWSLWAGLGKLATPAALRKPSGLNSGSLAVDQKRFYLQLSQTSFGAHWAALLTRLYSCSGWLWMERETLVGY